MKPIVILVQFSQPPRHWKIPAYCCLNVNFEPEIIEALNSSERRFAQLRITSEEKLGFL